MEIGLDPLLHKFIDLKKRDTEIEIFYWSFFSAKLDNNKPILPR